MLAYHQRLCSVKYVSLYGCTIHLFGCSLKCVLGWWFMVFNATFNNIPVISWQSVLLVEETGVPEKTGTDLYCILLWKCGLFAEISFYISAYWNQMRQITPHITGTVHEWSISRDHDHDGHCKLYGPFGVQVKSVV